MISTRVMDIKLREAAEGLGEDGTGKALAFPALGGGAQRGAAGARPLVLSAWRTGSVHSASRLPQALVCG